MQMSLLLLPSFSCVIAYSSMGLTSRRTSKPFFLRTLRNSESWMAGFTNKVVHRFLDFRHVGDAVYKNISMNEKQKWNKTKFTFKCGLLVCWLGRVGMQKLSKLAVLGILMNAEFQVLTECIVELYRTNAFIVLKLDSWMVQFPDEEFM